MVVWTCQAVSGLVGYTFAGELSFPSGSVHGLRAHLQGAVGNCGIAAGLGGDNRMLWCMRSSVACWKCNLQRSLALTRM